MIDSALLITAAFFSLYGIACAMECGVGINLLLDKKSPSRKYFTPVWELTNTFLVFGFTAFVVLFNNSLQIISHALLSTLVVGLFALLLRSCIVLLMFYVYRGIFPLWGRITFAVTNFAIPLSFSAAGIYLVTGEPFWSSIVGFMLIICVILGIVAIGKLFLDGQSDSKKKWSGLVLYSAWLMVLGSFLPLAIIYSEIGLQKWAVATLDLLSIAGLFMAYLAITDKTKFKLKYYAGFVGLAAPLLMALANRPFLVRGKITLADAYGAASYAGAFLVGSAIILPLVVLGFWLFIKLIREPS